MLLSIFVTVYIHSNVGQKRRTLAVTGRDYERSEKAHTDAYDGNEPNGMMVIRRRLCQVWSRTKDGGLPRPTDVIKY